VKKSHIENKPIGVEHVGRFICSQIYLLIKTADLLYTSYALRKWSQLGGEEFPYEQPIQENKKGRPNTVG